jgi:hypothetical protein
LLPAKVHRKHGRYYYVDRNTWHALSRVDEGPSALYDRLQAFTGDNPGSLGQIMGLYIARALPELKPASRPDYVRIITGRLMHHFGHLLPGELEPSHVAQYLEMRKREGAPAGGNRERAVLGSILSWAMRFGWVKVNPCHGVRRNREVPSHRYVTDAELARALRRASPALADLLEAAYLTGYRQTDLRLLRRSGVTSKGISLRQSKDGKLRTILFTPRLRRVVQAALARSGTDFVFVTDRARPWTLWGLQSAMRRLGAGFRFRDLRPKAATDAKENTLGHGDRMLAVYLRGSVGKAVR